MLNCRGILAWGLTLLLTTAALALPPEGYLAPTPDDQHRSIDNSTFIDDNLILMFVTNHGSWGRDLSGVFGYGYGTWFPYTGDTSDISNDVGGAGLNSPLYAAGLWIGGKVNGEKRVAIAEYESEYVPGPMAGGTYQPDNPAFRVYKLYSDSLADNPNQDYLDWPVDQGAPVVGEGNPAMRGNQMLWSSFNDADPFQHEVMGTDPLGIEVHMTTWSDEGASPYGGNVIYMEYRLYNRTSHTIDDMYVSLWADGDLGFPADDLVGCDSTLDCYFTYNGTHTDTHYGDGPPAVGIRIVHGPVVPSPGDTANFFGALLAGHKNLGMTAFAKYINGTDPYEASQAYNYMQGLDQDGMPFANGTKYMVPGDPVSGIGDIDTNPADRRMMGSCGPFTMQPGDSQYVLIKLACAQEDYYLTSISLLKTILSYEPVPPSILKAIIVPDTMYYFQNFVIEPDSIDSYLLLGYDGSAPAGPAVDPLTVSLNGMTQFESIETLSSYPGFSGTCWKFNFDIPEFLEPYGLFFDVQNEPFEVGGVAGGNPFDIVDTVMLVGHTTGDFNLDGTLDITDLVETVEFYFFQGTPPTVPEVIDVDRDGALDIGDLTSLIGMMF